MVLNLRAGPKWVPGVIVEVLGPLTYLVQLKTGMFWRRHIDQLRSTDVYVGTPHMADAPISLSDVPVSETESETVPNVPAIPDIIGEDTQGTPSQEGNPSTVPEAESTGLSPPPRRYPVRTNRKPPKRYT